MGQLMEGVRGAMMRREGERADRLKKETNQLAGSAYMGDPQAMQDLMQINPQMGMQIQQRQAQSKASTEQAGLDKRARFGEEMRGIMTDISKFSDFESSKGYAEAKMADMQQRYPEIAQSQGVDAVYDEGDFEQARTIYGRQAGASAFSGTGMEAQVSNMLTKGAEDPSFRSTPEYAVAWQKANEPKVIRTPTGDITLRPELSSMFKAPGDVSTEKEQVSNIKDTTKKDVEVIRGTEKELKTTADEKLSFGYLGRMESAEGSIKDLGNFDSADIWERFKGVTNITASTELQQYRQAADDWIRAKLRRESGAVIAQDEMDKEYQIYFPQIGDRQEVIDQKKRARGQAIGAMKTASGVEYKKQQQAKGAELKSRAAELEKELNL